jgi:hypothetical protein
VAVVTHLSCTVLVVISNIYVVFSGLLTSRMRACLCIVPFNNLSIYTHAKGLLYSHTHTILQSPKWLLFSTMSWIGM